MQYDGNIIRFIYIDCANINHQSDIKYIYRVVLHIRCIKFHVMIRVSLIKQCCTNIRPIYQPLECQRHFSISKFCMVSILTNHLHARAHLWRTLTYSMVQNPSWEANWFAASQEIPRISRNPKVHYRTHKRPPPVTILDQPNPVRIPTSHLHPNIIHPSTPRSLQWSLSLRFPHQDPIHSPLLTHTRHMPSPSHSSRFCHPHNIGWLGDSPVTSSLLGPNILNTLFSHYFLVILRLRREYWRVKNDGCIA